MKFEDFEFVKNDKNEDIILGHGAFSQVKLVEEITSKNKYAMKIVKFQI